MTDVKTSSRQCTVNVLKLSLRTGRAFLWAKLHLSMSVANDLSRASCNCKLRGKQLECAASKLYLISSASAAPHPPHRGG